MKFYNDHAFNKFLTHSLSTLSSFNIFEHIESQKEDRMSKKERERLKEKEWIEYLSTKTLFKLTLIKPSYVWKAVQEFYLIFFSAAY